MNSPADILIAMRTLDPPDETFLSSADEDELLREQLRESLIAIARRGEGPFWPTNDWKLIADAPKWDGEQYMPLMVALRRAKSGIGLTAAERWEIVDAAIEDEITEMIDAMERDR
jgi:hypothetical protein